MKNKLISYTGVIKFVLYDFEKIGDFFEAGLVIRRHGKYFAHTQIHPSFAANVVVVHSFPVFIDGLGGLKIYPPPLKSARFLLNIPAPAAS